MPDHLHWLFILGNTKSLPQLMQSIKSFTSLQISGKGGTAIWQNGYHDHAVRCDEDLAGIARYIIANPLRAALVDRIGDYAWWDAAWLETSSH